MICERRTKLRFSQNRPILQERIQRLETTVRNLEIDNTALKETVDLSDDPAIRRARRSNAVMTAGSIGWWGGAVGTTETFKFAAAFFLTGNEAAAFGLVAWMVACSVAAGPAERVAKTLAVRFVQRRYQTIES